MVHSEMTAIDSEVDFAACKELLSLSSGSGELQKQLECLSLSLSLSASH